MNPSCELRKLISIAIFGLMVILWTAAPVMAQTEVKVADRLAEALKLYSDLEFDKGIAVADELLTRSDITAQDSIAIYEVLSIITYAKGEEFQRRAFDYLEKISHLGPCVIPLPHDIWPKELRDKWYAIIKAKDALICTDPSKPAIKTIAIMEFDNFSVGKYQQELALLGKGLADFFEQDFGKIITLKVVERDKIDFVMKEIELQKSGNVDPATAVKIGKILGAQYMVFGSITQLDDKSTRMIVRAVKVETSEIVASVDKEGKPEYSKMEKELVEELAKKLDVQLNDQTKGLLQEGGTGSLDATAIYSQGLDYMDKYDYKNAYECFKKAYDLDNKFVEAKRKMDIYRPLAG
jgi:TolB-like protein